MCVCVFVFVFVGGWVYVYACVCVSVYYLFAAQKGKRSNRVELPEDHPYFPPSSLKYYHVKGSTAVQQGKTLRQAGSILNLFHLWSRRLSTSPSCLCRK